MNFKFPLASNSWDEKEHIALQRVIKSGRFTMGEEVKNFESLFSEYCGSKYSVMVNSGSSANLLMVAALFYTKNPDYKLERGDEVIVPAVSWSTTYFPLHQYGLKIRFVDIDLETLNFDLEQLADAVNERTKMIFPVNLLGNPNDFDRLYEIAGDKIIIEDNCESMGGEYKGKKTGTFGLMGSHSTFFSHHISTMEGGLIVTDDEELYHILLCLRAHGWTRNLPDLNRVSNKDSSHPLKENYRFVLPGYNVRPIELSGAIGVEQIKKLPALIHARRENALVFQQLMGHQEEILIQKEIGSSSWFGFSLVLAPGASITMDEFCSQLLAGGFEIRPIVAGDFSKSEACAYLDCERVGSLTNASYIDSHGVYIGNQTTNMEDAIHELVKTIGTI